jgi:hypothetical protein
MDSNDLGRFIGDLFVKDVFDGKGDDGFAGFGEEGVDFGEGFGRIIEGDEEAFSAVIEGAFFFAINIYSLFSG